jgi:hypothetical protein
MKQLKLFVAILFCIGLTVSCGKAVKIEKNYPVLHVDLNKAPSPLSEIFDRIELIPLETNDLSLIKSISKLKYSDGKFYILDEAQFILFIFDEHGKYLNRIAKRGQGPGEYTLIYDFLVNKDREQIEMLSPYKFIYCYDFDGKFIKKLDLRSLRQQGSTSKIQNLDSEYYAIWSQPEDNQDGILIVSQETGKLLNSFWQDLFIINSWAGTVFYNYNNEIYFSLSLYNIVYKVTKDGLVPAYEWDFGNKTMDITKYNISTGMYNYNQDIENLLKKLEDGTIPYSYACRFQNAQYYYAMLNIERKISKHIFYNKNNNKSYWYEYPITQFFLLYFSDEFIIGRSNSDMHKHLLESNLLDETSKQKLESYKEDDNPFLVKYYFKE